MMGKRVRFSPIVKIYEIPLEDTTRSGFDWFRETLYEILRKRYYRNEKCACNDEVYNITMLFESVL